MVNALTTKMDLPQFEQTLRDNNLVTFRLGRQAYALPLEPIVQIIPMVTITPLPLKNDALLGMINLHGNAIPVIDLRQKVGLGEISFELYTPIILANICSRTVSLVVDEVMDVVNVPAGHMMGLDSVFPEGYTDSMLLRGLVKINDHIVPLINPDELWRPDQAEELELAAQLANNLENTGQSVPPIELPMQMDAPDLMETPEPVNTQPSQTKEDPVPAADPDVKPVKRKGRRK
ncbi:MAG: hypothetical protein EHM70_00075 [Chloroflexota bacterium]|nr:MAG: hypothetical protein EHM70_00075 [Chloroflexota bacterium]